jgi:hypothetical protein
MIMRTWMPLMGIALLLLTAAPALAQATNPAAAGGSDTATQPPKAPATDTSAVPAQGQSGDHPRRAAGFGEHNPSMFRDVTDEEVNDILAFTRENMPQVNAELVKMKDSDPSHFKQMCRRLRFEIRQLRELKSSNPEAFAKALEEKQLQAHARDLAQSFRKSSDPAERDRLKTELRTTLQKLLDAELITKRAQIRRLEDNLKRVRDELQDRETHRDDVVSKQLEEMTSPRADADPLDVPKGDGKHGPKAEGKHEGKRPAGGDE